MTSAERTAACTICVAKGHHAAVKLDDALWLLHTDVLPQHGTRPVYEGLEYANCKRCCSTIVREVTVPDTFVEDATAGCAALAAPPPSELSVPANFLGCHPAFPVDDV